MRRLSIALALTVAAVVPSSVQAQDPGLHHLRAETELSFLERGVKLLYATITSRVFDPDLSKSLVEELGRAVTDVKRSAGKAEALLDEKVGQQAAKDFENLRAVLGQAERQLELVEEELKNAGGGEDEPEPELGAPGGEAQAGQPDWAKLKTAVGWLYADVSQAQRTLSSLGKRVKSPALKPPPKPAGKR